MPLPCGSSRNIGTDHAALGADHPPSEEQVFGTSAHPGALATVSRQARTPNFMGAASMSSLEMASVYVPTPWRRPPAGGPPGRPQAARLCMSSSQVGGDAECATA
jgi:hypothetical protein